MSLSHNYLPLQHIWDERHLILVLIICFLLISAVTLSAAPPSYFRGFTLIALKENREGDKEEDHAGTFQVRMLLGLPRVFRHSSR